MSDRIRAKYYSVYAEEHDLNYKDELRILEHENSIELDDETIDNLPNHFKTKAEAKVVSALIWQALSKGKTRSSARPSKKYLKKQGWDRPQPVGAK